jgi:starch synthase (maltosyl-transferring)
VDLDLARLGMDHGSEYEVHDVLGGGTYQWRGNWNYVELSPWAHNAQVFEVRALEAATRTPRRSP